MNAHYLKHYFKKVEQKNGFIYEIDGTENEIIQFKNVLGQHYREDNGKPLFFTKFYSGQQRALVLYRDNYVLDLKKLRFLETKFQNENHNLWKIIDQCVSKDPRIEKVKDLWSLNRCNHPQFNNRVHLLPDHLKTNLFQILNEYCISFSSHAQLNHAELNKYIEDIKDEEATMREISRDARSDSKWSNYNDNLGMRQQSQDFWDQF